MSFSAICIFSKGRIISQIAVIALSLAVIALLYDHISTLDLGAIFTHFRKFPLSAWALATLFTAISLAAVGGYDVVAVRYLRLDIPSRTAFAAGWRATAIAQTLGFGFFTGALVRWKLLSSHPSVPMRQAAQITAVVTACFFGGWAIVTSIAVIWTPGIAPQVWWIGLLGLWTVFSLFVLSLRPQIVGRRGLPPIRLVTRITVLAVLDTVAACIVIYCFLPNGYIPFLTLYSAFLLAYCAGMLSGVPCGLGPFEVSFLALVPVVDPTPLLAALIAYRVIYFAGPALVAVVSLRTIPCAEPVTASRWQTAANAVPPAEISLLAQGQLRLIDNPVGSSQSLGRQTANSEILFLDPFGGDPLSYLHVRNCNSKRNFRGLLAYKIGRRTASAAHALNMSVHQIGSEAVLKPDRFTLDTPQRAQLRRKLRNCAKKGVKVIATAPPYNQMLDIDQDWQRRIGPARGFSMGRFSPDLVAKQMVFTAYQADRPIAFATFHCAEDRWVLDLVRSRDNCPDGTNHMLIFSALEAARDCGITTFSLCSVPLFLHNQSLTWVERLCRFQFDHSKAARGLYQFKSSFDPEWEPQFIAADSVRTLIISGIELFCLIHMRQRDSVRNSASNMIHDHYDDYQFDSSTFACEEAR